MGYEVSGSDMVRSAAVRRLEGLGASVHVGHREENIRGAQCVVYSSAVSADNVELRAAEAAKIPIIPRAEMLAELMRMKYGVAIAGTHGKTTTTSLIASILGAAGMDPTVVTGGRLNSIGANARLGGGDLLVAEADESDGSFLRLSPAIAVVTSIDREHMNHYGSMEEVLEAYAGFMNKVPFYGCAILCLDHPAIQGLLPRVTRRVLTYGLATQADVRGSSIGQRGLETEFDLMLRGRRLGRLLLRMPGTYNVQNALAASAVALELGPELEGYGRGGKGVLHVVRAGHPEEEPAEAPAPEHEVELRLKPPLPDGGAPHIGLRGEPVGEDPPRYAGQEPLDGRVVQAEYGAAVERDLVHEACVGLEDLFHGAVVVHVLAVYARDHGDGG